MRHILTLYKTIMNSDQKLNIAAISILTMYIASHWSKFDFFFLCVKQIDNKITNIYII